MTECRIMHPAESIGGGDYGKEDRRTFGSDGGAQHLERGASHACSGPERSPAGQFLRRPAGAHSKCGGASQGCRRIEAYAVCGCQCRGGAVLSSPSSPPSPRILSAIL